MTLPVLYKGNETTFGHLGLGVLADAFDVFVEEERNGQFFLEMKYPVSGAMFDELKNDRLIKVDAGTKLKNQRFKIVKITKPTKGIINIYAEHISYHTQEMQLKPKVSYNGNAQSALNSWKNNIIDQNPFTVYSDITHESKGEWLIDKVDSARRALGGVAGSILDSYGGEYRFDNYHIGLYQSRGNDNGALIAYGKNLTELEQEEEISNTYTSIYPYSILRDEEAGADAAETTVTLPEYFIDSEHAGNFARRNIRRIDFSEEKIDNVDNLRKRAIQYAKANDVGVPKVNLKVKFVDLAKTLDYKHLKLIEEINLCDWVTVYFEKYGIRQKAKVIKTTWNVLLDRYESIELGESRASLSQSIEATVDGMIQPVVSRLNIIQVAANGKNKVFRGPQEPQTGMTTNDLWYKPVGDGEIELYNYDGNIWKLEKVSAGLLSGVLDAANGDVNLINVNVAHIVGETSNFVQSAWNDAAGGSVRIEGEGILSTAPNSSQTYIQDGIVGTRNPTGATIGQMGYFNYGSSPVYTATTSNGSHYRIQNHLGGGQYKSMFELLNGGAEAYIRTDRTWITGGLTVGGNTTLQHALYMSGDNVSDVNRLEFVNGGSIDAQASNSDIRIQSSNKLWLRTSESAAMYIDHTHVYMYRTLSMENNAITNQSDERLKENIEDSEFNAYELFLNLRPREFEWKNKERFGSQREIGFIAQEIHEIDPELITQTPDEDSPDGIAWAINETQMNRKSWVALHQVTKEVEYLKAENKMLKDELAKIKEHLNLK